MRRLKQPGANVKRGADRPISESIHVASAIVTTALTRSKKRPVGVFSRHQCESAAAMACDLDFGSARAPRRPSVSEGYSPNNK